MLPSFLCIGAQKSGTTWLFKNLDKHPDIWLPPPKEMHYFENRNESLKDRWNRITRRRWLYRACGNMARDIVQASPSSFAWNLKYFWGHRNDAWYSSLYEMAGNKYSGDITPAYSTLELEEIRAVHALIPDAKLILLLRNPIERAWSAALMNVKGERGEFKGYKGQISEVPFEVFCDYFNRDGVEHRSNYMRTIHNWTNFYPKEKLFIGFMEDIKQRPVELLNDLYRFLELEQNHYLNESDSAEKPVLVGTGQKMPLAIKEYLTAKYTSQIDLLAPMFQDQQAKYIKAWQKEAHNTLKARS